MTYLYENCGPENFQYLCQALLIAEYPGLQCYPVGQRDGGRDAFQPADEVSITTVVQVKFKRKEEQENADWMIAALEGELPKIQKLIAAGASRYVMVTNAAGTSYPGSGSIDKVQTWLDDNVTIPAQCLWRDDLDRRTDRAPSSLKYTYPHILTANQGIELAIESSIRGDATRRQGVVRSFVQDQFSKDRFVKFKQVDLSNEILDLFVDVPVHVDPRRMDPLNGSGDEFRSLIYRLSNERYARSRKAAASMEMRYHRRLEVGAAEFLLSDAAQQHMKKIILQGGPGQGKSTLAQYVCQIHRAHYLNERNFLDKVPAEHTKKPFRLPFKIDLRDLAVYLEAELAGQGDHAQRTILTFETFLANLIHQKGGGRNFDVDDLYATLKSVPSLIFLDGLDEVAEFAHRQNLVEQIQIGLQRLEGEGIDMQVVVTSRPSIFGRMPSFGKSQFSHIRLAHIGPVELFEYSEKWIAARGLAHEDGAITRTILEEKIRLDHIRDLTRNPMQLAILLSLIHSVGYSLPNERTDLYQKYVDIFLTREADKDLTVREHRKLLVETVEYVAWMLQSRAENGRLSGSVSREELRVMVADYLARKQESSDIFEMLFERGLERIYVLVERNEGLFEFEVQPLREFFCARFLYDRAPVGVFREAPKDDRSARLAVMSRNPFWLNVVRFYAGFFTTGELGTLMLTLKELINDTDPFISIHARRIAAALLSDWVFRSAKYTQKELIASVFDSRGVYLTASGCLSLEPDIYTLHSECGAEDLKNAIFQCYSSTPDSPHLSTLDELLKANGGQQLREQFIQVVGGSKGQSRTYRLARMAYSGALSGIAPDDVLHLFTVDNPSPQELLTRALVMLQAEPLLLVRVKPLQAAVIRGSLEGRVPQLGFPTTPLGVLVEICSGILRHLDTLLFAGEELSAVIQELEEVMRPDSEKYDPRVVAVMQEFKKAAAKPYSISARATPVVEPYVKLVEGVRSAFGDCWAMYSLAVSLVGISDNKWRGKGADSLFESQTPLLHRARYARLRSSPSGWMRKQLDAASSRDEIMFCLALSLAWFPMRDIAQLESDLTRHMDGLSEDEYNRLLATLTRTDEFRKDRGMRGRKADRNAKFTGRLGMALAVAVSDLELAPATARSAKGGGQLPAYYRKLVAKKELEAFSGFSRLSPQAAREKLLLLRTDDPILMPEARAAIFRAARSQLGEPVSLMIVNEPLSYPAALVDQAVSSISARYRGPVIAKVATRDNWAVT